MSKATPRALEAVRRLAARASSRELARRRPGDHHRRPRLRPHHAVDRPQPRIRAAAGLSGRRPSPASTSACARRSPTSARPSPKTSACASAKGTSFLNRNPMRKPVMAGNWKMYKTPAETTALLRKVPSRWWRAPSTARSSSVRRTSISPPPSPPRRGARIADRRAESRSGPRKAHITGEVSGPMITRHRRNPRRSSATASAASISARPTRPCSRRPRPRSKPGSHPIVCVGETSRRARGGQDRARVSTSSAAAASPDSPMSSSRKS